MKLGSLTISTALGVGLVAGAALWLSWCHDPKARQEAFLQVSGDTTDARVARLAAEQIEREAAWTRTLKRQNQEIAGIRHRADSLQNEVLNARNAVVTGSDTLIPKPLVVAALAAKDSVIASANRQVAFYMSQVATYRDTIIPRLMLLNAELSEQRNAWQHRAQPGLVTRLVRAAPWIAGAWLLGRARVP